MDNDNIRVCHFCNIGLYIVEIFFIVLLEAVTLSLTSGNLVMRAVILAFIAVLPLSGCSSEVDKCVEEWEKANPGPDNSSMCRPDERDTFTRECHPEAARTKAQARVEMRLLCLQASKK